MLTESEAGHEMNSLLDALGIQRGDCVMIGIDMSKLPLPSYKAALNKDAFRERERKWFEFVLNRLLQRLGDEGTILVPSYSYSCGKAGSVFDNNSTKSEVGPFTEFFRTYQGVTRSLHPIFSVSGMGKFASHILTQTGRSGFGSGSPFERFRQYQVKFLCLGVEIKNSITYIHHLEQCYGSPHRYHKRFDVQVFDNGVKQDGEWYAYVGYRGIDYESDISSLQQELEKAGALTAVMWNGAPSHVATIADVDSVGYGLLRKNAYSFVQKNLNLHFDDSREINRETKGISELVVTDKIDNDTNP